jgi:hypothetical protein
MIAVNPDGVLGVFYYSTEGQPDRQHFDTYFTASLDGGETFLPKARVSSQTSYPFGGGNLRPGPTVRTDARMTVLYTTSGLSRWPDGGDYIGMTVGLGRARSTRSGPTAERHRTSSTRPRSASEARRRSGRTGSRRRR